MIRLTDDQSQEISEAGNEPVRVLDPSSARQFVLVSESEYDRIQELLRDEQERRGIAESSWQALSRLLKAEPW
jgi:hypothetical protein